MRGACCWHRRPSNWARRRRRLASAGCRLCHPESAAPGARTVGSVSIAPAPPLARQSVLARSCANLPFPLMQPPKLSPRAWRGPANADGALDVWRSLWLRCVRWVDDHTRRVAASDRPPQFAPSPAVLKYERIEKGLVARRRLLRPARLQPLLRLCADALADSDRRAHREALGERAAEPAGIRHVEVNEFGAGHIRVLIQRRLLDRTL